jgi:hypothetical protein
MSETGLVAEQLILPDHLPSKSLQISLTVADARGHEAKVTDSMEIGGPLEKRPGKSTR